MIDREKVIKGLELCKEACYMEKCPYWNGSMTDGSCMLKLHDDALDLLKEQEPVRPEYDPVNKRHLCPMCKAELDSYVGGYCYSCGRGLDWDGA